MEGGQVMVVCIVALVMLTSLIKASIQSKNNANKKDMRKANENTAQTDELLFKMNDQLDRITARLTALETIVTDEDRELKREFQTLKSDVSNVRKSVDTDRY
ncbi:hypothetical protein [Hirschia baltica]|uniref:Uncharacterized protein n=1 Tax=Hirschia baltica (strain ATCC 49814 / DSM 5838 / IFAM 1418) TaxID=582402 RepID=C6XR69_HIRBI|nr:hypothetical protein [Hirschia baltica]ACT60600.1 hypothetical protein Hbal_2931 [Hirschia baltica ATCC 49814]